MLNDYSLTRPGEITPATLQDALRRHGRPAVAVLVAKDKKTVADAFKALKTLGLPLPVQEQPGVLVGEIGIL